MKLWIAKDKNGYINAFLFKPEKHAGRFNGYWATQDVSCIWSKISPSVLSEFGVTPRWEDKEPIQIDLDIKAK